MYVVWTTPFNSFPIRFHNVYYLIWIGIYYCNVNNSRLVKTIYFFYPISSLGCFIFSTFNNTLSIWFLLFSLQLVPGQQHFAFVFFRSVPIFFAARCPVDVIVFADQVKADWSRFDGTRDVSFSRPRRPQRYQYSKFRSRDHDSVHNQQWQQWVLIVVVVQ
jgi:hypothetical protein